MARKRSILGAALVLGGVAAAGYLIYRNREMIRGFVEELVYTPEADEPEYEGVVIDFEPPAGEEEENDIVIDRTLGAEEPEDEAAASPSAAEG